jgi:hypothetical protein
MGTDMHMMVEISQDGEPWRLLMPMPIAHKCPRNYAMFALLADVRNSAGRIPAVWMEEHQHTDEASGREFTIPGHWYDVEDGGQERIIPIDAPRGVPDDATLEWQANVLIWQQKSNSVETTWLTAEEILGANWDQVVIRKGIVMEADYIELTETGKTPDMHVGGFGGEGALEVSEEEYAEGKRGERATLVRAHWTEGPLRAMVPGFLTMVQGIVESKGDSTKVRFMLLFES